MKDSQFFAANLSCCKRALTFWEEISLWQTLLGNHRWALNNIQALQPWIWFIMLLKVTHWRMRNLGEAICHEPWAFLHFFFLCECKTLTTFRGPYLTGFFLAVSNPERLEIVSLRSRFIYCYKMLNLPSSGFFACDTTHCMCRHSSRPILHHLGGMGKWHKYAHVTSCTTNNKVLCLLSRSHVFC